MRKSIKANSVRYERKSRLAYDYKSLPLFGVPAIEQRNIDENVAQIEAHEERFKAKALELMRREYDKGLNWDKVQKLLKSYPTMSLDEAKKLVREGQNIPILRPTRKVKSIQPTRKIRRIKRK